MNAVKKRPAQARGKDRPKAQQIKTRSYSRRRFDWQAPLQTDDRGNIGLDQGGLFEVFDGRQN